MLSAHDYNKMLFDNLEIRDKLINSFVKDPFDEERDFFVSVIKELIPYLR